MLRTFAPALTVLLFCGAPLWAQQWAVDMFETTKHNFGSVARGAKTECEFVLSNLYVEDVHIAAVRSSCGCTSPRIKTPWLKTYEKGAIIAKLNTNAFLGRKGATVTVTLDKPYRAEVQLQVRSYIRSDVVLHPGSVQFGDLECSTPAEQKVAVSYAGRSDWRILDVRSDNPHLSGGVVETGRGRGRVNYELTVQLDSNMPTGYVNDHLMLITNDRRSTQIPVAIEGRVLSGITVSPASLFMGVVQPGQKVTKQLVLRSKKPFRVLSVSADGGSFEFDTSQQQEPKAVHLIPVTFIAGEDPGKVSQTIHIETDVSDSAPVLPAFAVVAAQ